ncbi:transposase [Pseudomonas knackmussii]|uniref:transposase n=1 Tax=Pseudomonas knackmussii TaxID=65741 RepID=UPI0012EBD1B8
MVALRYGAVYAKATTEVARRRFPESLKREAVSLVLAGTPLRHVAESLGIAERLLGEWKGQYEQQGGDGYEAFG